jgi:hypothetical protein
MPLLEDLKSDYARAEATLNVAAEVREEALQDFMAAQGVKKRLADAQEAYERAVMKWGAIGDQIEALGGPKGQLLRPVIWRPKAVDHAEPA